jgi:hypothetical protein
VAAEPLDASRRGVDADWPKEIDEIRFAAGCASGRDSGCSWQVDRAGQAALSEDAMHAVVNHMKLSTPLDDNIIDRMNSELMAKIAKMPGVANALCVQVADDGIVVVVVCESAESLERVHQEVGLPWVRENLKPYLASTDRKVGPVIARPQDG